jgi:hypothetical protein
MIGEIRGRCNEKPERKPLHRLHSRQCSRVTSASLPIIVRVRSVLQFRPNVVTRVFLTRFFARFYERSNGNCWRSGRGKK